MFTIRLADLNIGIDNKYTYIEQQCKNYMVDAETDFNVSVSDSLIAAEADNFEMKDACFEPGYLESLALYRQISEKLLDYSGFLIHSAVISVSDRAVAFAARSGTGKTTHINLWRRLLGEDCVIINGDKPLIRFFDGVPFAYGTPWAGKENFNTNTRAPLTDICFLTRAKENSIKTIDRSDAVKRLLSQIYLPKNPLKKIKTLELADLFMNSVNIWEIGCNMEINAAKTVYSKIFERN